MSVTSREVAAILSSAGPLAPPSDDDTEYDVDDVSELDEQSQLSSSLRPIRASSRSSSSSNTSMGTPVGHSTPPCKRDNQLTPIQSQSSATRLNNSRYDRRADEFRPNLNGICDRIERLDIGQMNGDLRSTARSHHQHVALCDLLRTHHLLLLTLEARLNNGHHIRGPPFQVSSREVIRSRGQR